MDEIQKLYNSKSLTNKKNLKSKSKSIKNINNKVEKKSKLNLDKQENVEDDVVLDNLTSNKMIMN